MVTVILSRALLQSEVNILEIQVRSSRWKLLCNKKLQRRPVTPEIVIFKSADGIQTCNFGSDCTHARLGYMNFILSLCPDVGKCNAVFRRYTWRVLETAVVVPLLKTSSLCRKADINKQIHLNSLTPFSLLLRWNFKEC